MSLLRHRTALIWAVAALLSPVGAAAPALAVEVDRATYDALVDAAIRGDATAERELAEITAVDGKPADLGLVVDDRVDGVDRRLEALDRPDFPPLPLDPRSLVVPSGQAGRGDNGERESSSAPDPSVATTTVGTVPDQQTAGSDRGSTGRGRDLSGLLVPLGVVFGAALVVALVIAATRASTPARARRAVTEPGSSRPAEPPPDAAEALESAASAAEAAGDLETAIRLRYRAGVLRLERARVVAPDPSRTSRQLLSAVMSASLSEVVADHDAVVFGARPASPEQAARSRLLWPAVLEEASR